MKHEHHFDSGHFGESVSFLPSGMSPSFSLFELGFGVGTVVDDGICSLDEFEDILVDFSFYMFCIGDVADGKPFIIDAVSAAPIRVVERGCSDGDSVSEIEGIAYVEGVEILFGFHGFDRNGEARFGHLT